jgi:hypothetical protein
MGLVRLAIPAGMAILALILEDAYAKVPRPAKALARGPLLGIGFALASQGIFRIGNPELAVPGWIAFYGSATGFLMSCAVRMLFPPGSQQLQGAQVPAGWLKRSGGSAGDQGRAVAFRDSRIAISLLFLMLVLLVAYEVWKRG